jgi:hypothetical protein
MMNNNTMLLPVALDGAGGAFAGAIMPQLPVSNRYG